MNPAVINDPNNAEHQKQLRPSLLEVVSELDPMDQIALLDFLKGGRLPMLRSLSRLCKAGLLRSDGVRYVPARGVHEALAAVRKIQTGAE